MGKSEPKAPKETPKKAVSKPKKQMEDDELEEDEDDDDTGSVKSTSNKSPKPAAKKGKDNDEDEEETDVEEVDDWEKPEEEDSWDPDFEEFDLPKSKAKKSSTAGKKAGKGEEDDLSIDEDFKDMDLFNDSGIDDDEDDY